MRVFRGGRAHRKVAQGITRGRLARMSLFAIVAGATLLAAVATGMVLHKNGTARSISDHFARFGYEWRKLTAAQEFAPERLELDLKHLTLQRLAFDRERGLSAGILNPETCEDSPGVLRSQDRRFPVDVRLKGVFPDHWQHSYKWSLKVSIKNDDTLFGMRTFALQHPGTRDYAQEWLFMRALEAQGLIAHRLRFVELVVNGDDLGLYALEEQFSESLIEHNSRRAGPIIGFDKSVQVDALARMRDPAALDRGIFDNRNSYSGSPIEVAGAKQLLNDAQGKRQLERAIMLLESFRNRSLSPAHVFELDKLARLLALCALFGAAEFDWRDFRVYYNPIVDRLEPIGREIHVFGARKVTWWLTEFPRDGRLDLLGTLFADREFLAAYTQALAEVSRPEFLVDLLNRARPELTRIESLLALEFPDCRLDARQLEDNRAFIVETLAPAHAVHAFVLATTGEKTTLRLGNRQSLPIEIVAVSHKGRVLAAPQLLLAGKKLADAVSYEDVVVAGPLESGLSDSEAPNLLTKFDVHYRVLGLAPVSQVAAAPWALRIENADAHDIMRADGNLNAHPFLAIDAGARRIEILPGTWTLTTDLIIPAGYTVYGFAGTVLQMGPGTTLLSRSALDLGGDLERPFVLEAAGAEGLMLLDAPPSRFVHVVFRGLSAPRRAGWELSGAITCYQSDVRFEHCYFSGTTRSDDLLNVVRSRFSLDHCYFATAPADAFDADFSSGSIRDSVFSDIGADAIDVSASTIELARITIVRTNGRAVSAGERCEVRGADVSISAANLGLTSRNAADLALANVQIADTKIGCAVYHGEPEYGPGRMRVTQLKQHAVDRPYLVEGESSLSVDNQAIVMNQQFEPASRDAVAHATHRD
ncbi:MAG: CotH kinase family protein [Planctomycetota bacterium]